MDKPAAVRRIKSYSAETGLVYQYYFRSVQTAHAPLSGKEYVYMVSADRKTMFALKIFLRQDALDEWAQQSGRTLSGTEEYAVAKMRLFQAFDQVADLALARPELIVDRSNITGLLSQLDL